MATKQHPTFGGPVLEEAVNGFVWRFPAEVNVRNGERTRAHQPSPAGSPLSIMLRAFAFQWSIIAPSRWFVDARCSFQHPFNFSENFVQQHRTPSTLSEKRRPLLGRHAEDIVRFSHAQGCKFSGALSSDMADVDKLQEIGLAPVSYALLEGTDALNEVGDHGKVLVSKHIIGQQDLLGSSKSQPIKSIR